MFLICGLALFFEPLVSKRRRSRWASGLMLTAAGLVILKGAVELLLYYSVLTLSPTLQRGLPRNLDFIGGLACGIFLALAFSGELGGRRHSEIAKTI